MRCARLAHAAPRPPRPPPAPAARPPAVATPPPQDAETLEKYRANELLHARWAMLAAAGAIIPEGLAANGADVKGATWFETGAAMLNGGTLNWFAVPIANISNPLPLFAVVAVNTALMAAVENYRRMGA